MQVGMNLGAISYYSPMFLFTNLMEQTNEWAAAWQPEGLPPATWETDADDNLIALDGPVYKMVIQRNVSKAHGTYACLWDGDADVSVNKPGKKTGPNQIDFEVTNDAENVILLVRSGKGLPENIRIYAPGADREERFNPLAIEFLRQFDAPLRCMDHGMTPYSMVEHWEDRRPDTSTTQMTSDVRILTPNGRKTLAPGASIGMMIELANKVGRDLWLCIPTMATDDYTRKLAEQVRDELDPSLKLYIEYSNEMPWNYWKAYAREQAALLGGLGTDNIYHAGFRYYAKRAVETMAICKEVLGNRLVRVISGQAAQGGNSRQALFYEKAYEHFDAYAIAVYFSDWSVRDRWATDDRPTLDDIFTACSKNIEGMRSGTGRGMRFHKTLADEAGLPLIMYEGGPGLEEPWPKNDLDRQTLYAEASAHPKMGELVTQFLNMVSEEGCSLLCYFSAITPDSKYGYWGIKTSMFGTSPKEQAVLNFVGAVEPTVEEPPVESSVEDPDDLSSRFETAMTELTAIGAELIRRG